LLSTNVGIAEEHHQDGGAIMEQKSSGNGPDSKSGSGPNADGTQKDAGATDKGGTPPPNSKDGAKSFESKATNSGSQNKDLGDPRDLHDIDTNVTVRPSLDPKRQFGNKDGRDFFKDHRELGGFRDFSFKGRDGFKRYTVPRGKFAKYDKKPGEVGLQSPVRNALGLAVANTTPDKQTPTGSSSSGLDNKGVSGPIKNSIGLSITDAGHLGLASKDGKVELSTPAHLTPNGPSISGTGINASSMDKGATHAAAIGGAKLNLQGISGNSVHYKH
jgi:hypothetical protein